MGTHLKPATMKMIQSQNPTRAAIFAGAAALMVLTPQTQAQSMGDVEVMRYHSLSLENIKSPINTIASTSDDIPMALEHETLPIAGFQFHPDSFGTSRGTEMIHSFFKHAL